MTPQSLFEAHHDYLRALAYRLTRNEADAEDVVQDVFLNVVRKLHQYRGEASPLTWLHRITVNVSLRLLRRRRHTVPLPHDLVAREDERCRGDTFLDLEVRISELSAAQQPVLRLRLAGFRSDGIGTTLGISLAAVKSRLRRGIRHLRKVVKVP